MLKSFKQIWSKKSHGFIRALQLWHIFCLDMGISDAIAALSDNPVFGGGAALGIMAAGLGVLKKLSTVGMMEARRRFTASIEVTLGEEQVFKYLGEFITKQESMSNHATMSTFFTKNKFGGNEEQFKFQPAPGKHFMMYDNLFIQVERHRASAMTKSTFSNR